MIEDLKTINLLVFASLFIIGILDDFVYVILTSDGFELARTKSTKTIRDNSFYKLVTKLTPIILLGITIYSFWIFHWSIPIFIFLTFLIGKALSKPIYGLNKTIRAIINKNLSWIYIAQPLLIGYIVWSLIFN